VSTAALSILPYDLPDAQLLQPQAKGAACATFVPSQIMVVIGKGSQIEQELNLPHIAADGVPVLRRPSGGCAVVLTPNMLAVSFVRYETKQQKSAEYFARFNEILMHALNRFGGSDIEQRGTSDIARHGRKLVGTAIYRNRELVFFQAIINVAESADLLERYLKLPPRMPDYRTGRAHRDFVASLRAEGFTASIEELIAAVRVEFAGDLKPSSS
jgi:lipoate---protein ligase